MAKGRKISPAEVQRSLQGVDYPCDKTELIMHAKDHDAPRELISLIERLPDREFESPLDVSRELHDHH